MTDFPDRILTIGKTNYNAFSKLLDKQGLWDAFFAFLQNEDVKERFMEPKEWLEKDKALNQQMINNDVVGIRLRDNTFGISVDLKEMEHPYVDRISPLVLFVQLNNSSLEQGELNMDIVDKFPSLRIFKNGMSIYEKTNGKWEPVKFNKYTSGELKQVSSDVFFKEYNERFESLKKLAFDLKLKAGNFKNETLG